MANEVQVFDNLKVKEVNGQVMFDAETAAIGMGLVDISKGTLNSSNNNYKKHKEA